MFPILGDLNADETHGVASRKIHEEYNKKQGAMA